MERIVYMIHACKTEIQSTARTESVYILVCCYKWRAHIVDL